MSAEFIPGLELSRGFYAEAVEPLLRRHHPTVRHAAACIGEGSEVLGFDTSRSMDHDWGPGVQIFLSGPDLVDHAVEIDKTLADELPKTYRGFPTNFVVTEAVDSIKRMSATGEAVRHRVTIDDHKSWMRAKIGFDPEEGVTLLDWLGAPTQVLAEVTGGEIFRDDLGGLTAARNALAWYPPDVWRYVLACQWLRIAREESYAARAGEAGDEVGSAVIAAQLVRDIMRLGLLMARRYPPYSKWLGTAFHRLPFADSVNPALRAALHASTGVEREEHIATALGALAEVHNALGLTEPVDTGVRPYLDRPYRVFGAQRPAAALLMDVQDPDVFSLPLVGAIDQYVNNTDLLTDCSQARGVAAAAGTAVVG